MKTIQKLSCHTKEIFFQQIEVLKENSSIDQLIKGLNEINLQKLNYGDQKQKVNAFEVQEKQNIEVVTQNYEEQLRVKKYEYQLIPESSIKLDESLYCSTISFNYDGSIIAAGCGNKIKVFEFKNKQLKEIQSLKLNEYWIPILKFMNKSNQFISVESNSIIHIRQVNNKKELINIQTLKREHKDWINSIIINQNDDLFASGSSDNSIIFWGLNDNKWQIAQQIQCSSKIWCLSFNDSNTKLISCEDDKLIEVFEQQGKKWIVSEKIQVETEGKRSCFLSDDQFAFLPWKGISVQFYKFDQQTNLFKKQYEVQVNNGDDDQYFWISDEIYKKQESANRKKLWFWKCFKKVRKLKFYT